MPTLPFPAVRRRPAVVLAALVAFGLATATLSAQSSAQWIEKTILGPSPDFPNAVYGQEVAIDGDTIVVGAPEDGNLSEGAVYVYRQIAGAWTEEGKLGIDAPKSSDVFGHSVAIQGDTIVIGARGRDGKGAAYVFERSGTTWTQVQKLAPSDLGAADNFGANVAIDGQTIVVGSHLDDMGTVVDQGSVYIFGLVGAVWTQQQKLFASDGAANDHFGTAVAISGDTIAVGAEYDDRDGATNLGAAYIFTKSGAAWAYTDTLKASDAEGGDRFGTSVALEGNTLVVGARDAGVTFTKQGVAYVFSRQSGDWE
jgi:hypothetical protein